MWWTGYSHELLPQTQPSSWPRRCCRKRGDIEDAGALCPCSGWGLAGRSAGSAPCARTSTVTAGQEGDRSTSTSELTRHSKLLRLQRLSSPSEAAERFHALLLITPTEGRRCRATVSFVFIWERSHRAAIKNAKACGFRAEETVGETSQEEEMKGKFGEQHTAGPSSPWGQRPGQHPKSRLHLLLVLSSSLSSPLGGASSSSASPALIGWSPGTHRWAWLHLRLLSKDLEKQVVKMN